MTTTMTTATTAVDGHVAEFDGDRGLGRVTSTAGPSYPFHCIDIADGSREIPVGAPVTFVPVPKLGRYEAVRIRRR